MNIYRLLAISYSFVIGGTAIVEWLLRRLDRKNCQKDKKDSK